ncbi:RCC1 domain-containing protein [Haliangium ochraceum]|uniref:Alpha-tubulin suppressor and related RCC1 domain-containing protein-like protein n=1 Tax=Haliangium ochraceum (strain DSM 14365 / JCM 11303 / SMP-2) TaxID=502025 RepID=D0LRZ3_HALO1|nr:alpha-L-fucosidase [Haliangium ochraceum]ACY13690.1 Alpha-tubulin suppressor and related RCC1 domain- containing protein-like protein [Haliangium ochraceum DSM 14365]
MGIAFASLSALGAGCAVEPDSAAPPIDPPSVTPGEEGAKIQIRFHGRAMESSLSGLDFRSFLAPLERSDVSKILVDVSNVGTGLPFAVNFALTQESAGSDVWFGTLPFLPSGEELRFFAKAYDENEAMLFSGETLVTLTIANQGVVIPLAPAQDQETFDLPRLVRVVYPSEMVAGQENQIVFTIEGNAGETVDYALTSTDGSTPFAPPTGSVTLSNTVADFIALYTPPDVEEASDFGYRMTLTSADSLSSVSLATDFTTHVLPRDAGVDGLIGTRPSVLFAPVVRNLEANGSAIPGEVELFADVSDDTDEADLAYQWSFTPNEGTPAAAFADGGTSNPGRLQGYSGEIQGTISLAVSDTNGGTTTLFYEILPEQFTHIVDNDAANGLRRIVAGDAHTCVLTGEDQVRCWGDNQYGQLGYGHETLVGDGNVEFPHPYTAGDVPLFQPVRQLVAGNNHTCALLESGLMYCWGDNQYGQLGYNTTEGLGDGEPVTSFGYVTLGGLATRIAAGGDHTCAILEGGALRCWGKNAQGQLGRGSVENIGDDENVYLRGNVDLGAGVEVVDIALGGYHTCALLADGAVRCWGYNAYGQLGYGNTEQQGDTESIADLENVSLPGPVRKIVAGLAHTCVLLKNNNRLRCWGHGGEGRLGYGFRPSNNLYVGDQPSEIPINLLDVPTGADVTDVIAGSQHTCALLSSGDLKCWGEGSGGVLGYGNSSDRSGPDEESVGLGGASAYQIAAGAYHTCALRSTGAARCWGFGLYGRLGSGGAGNLSNPNIIDDILVFGENE